MGGITKFAKENPSLAAGIFLPVLLVILFALASAIPQWTVAAPQYDALFLIDPYNNNGDILIGVTDGHLKGQYRLPRNPVYNNQHMSLYRFEAKTQSLREIVLQAPPAAAEVKSGDWAVFDLPEELQKLNINPSQTSPDGYAFRARNAYENGGGWMFYNHYHSDIVFYKDGRNIIVNPASGNVFYNYTNVKFIGWVMPGGTAQ